MCHSVPGSALLAVDALRPPRARAAPGSWSAAMSVVVHRGQQASANMMHVGDIMDYGPDDKKTEATVGAARQVIPPQPSLLSPALPAACLMPWWPVRTSPFSGHPQSEVSEVNLTWGGQVLNTHTHTPGLNTHRKHTPALASVSSPSSCVAVHQHHWESGIAHARACMVEAALGACACLPCALNPADVSSVEDGVGVVSLHDHGALRQWRDCQILLTLSLHPC